MQPRWPFSTEQRVHRDRGKLTRTSKDKSDGVSVYD